MSVEFTIPGKPMSKGRPRVTRYGTYTPKETTNYETLVKWTYQTLPERRFFEGQIMVHIAAYFPIPQRTSKKMRKQMLSYDVCYAHKPDCDNIAKIILDALNGIAYKDDGQVVSLTVDKLYSDEPRVVVTLSEYPARF